MSDEAPESETTGSTPPGVGFFFIRHGQTAANRDGVRSGAESDTHLTEVGRDQACRAAETLRGHGVRPSLILTSPLSRTMETAEILNARLGLELDILTEPGLLERRLGAWNGQSVEATQPALAAGETPPGGESSAAFRARVLAAFDGLAAHFSRWPLIVSSRGVARVLMEQAGRKDAAALPNCALLRVTLADSVVGPAVGSGGECDFAVAGIDHLDPLEPRTDGA